MTDLNELTGGDLAAARRMQKRTIGKSQLTDSVALNHGKVPPQAVDLEEAVLGALMLEREAVNKVIDLLYAKCFYVDAHQKIYEAILSLFNKTQPVDILTVTQELRTLGTLELVGGAFFIAKLTNRVASAANIEFHARIILEKHIQRELIRISSETIRDAYEDTTDVLDLLDTAEKNLFEIAEGNIKKNYETMQDLIRRAVKEVEVAATHDSGVTGIPSGFTQLDRVTSGWQKSDLIILAARPGVGKTAFVLTLARNAAIGEIGKPAGVAFFSLEMSSVQLVKRLISSETGLTSEKLKKGNLANHEWEQLNSRIARLTDAPIFIDDSPALSIFEFRAKCRRLKAQHNIQMIIIDYLQLMTAGRDNKNGTREQEISNISRSLKAIAKELEVPIIALSQLSRAVETRTGSKKPQLSDLRESGAIEQDADMVMFIYRPEYHGMDQDADGNSMKGIAEICIAKHRNGALEDVQLRFIAEQAKFTDLEGDYFNSPFTQQLPPAQEQNNFNKIIRSSRMNDDDFSGPPPF